MQKNLNDWLLYMQGIHVSAIDMGLSRVLPVAEHLGVIESAKQAYIFTVAGTNGKGSTTSVIANICQQAGYKTALYQSPHLTVFNERVTINGHYAKDDELIHAFERVEQARLHCGLSLSFFEMTTLAAFLIFADAKCDVWVLEVGLGGRLDVVNIIDPDLAVITNIGIDHTDWLGDNREEIGYEKAGILRKNMPLIYGEEDMPTSVAHKINELNVVCYQATKDFFYQLSTQSNESASIVTTNNQLATVHDNDVWQYSNAAVTMQLPRPNVYLMNVANAISAVLASNLLVEIQHIKQAMQQVKLAGRFDYRKLAGTNWLFDVAHNPQGVQLLLNQLTPNLSQYLPKNGKLVLLFSMLADKDIEQVVHLLQMSSLPISHWHVAPIDFPRAADLAMLKQCLLQVEAVKTNNVSYYSTLTEATQQVMLTTNEQDLVLVCGSFHTIKESLCAINV